MTRVLLIANTLPPQDISGVGEQVLQLAAGLRRRGMEVEVLGRGTGGARGPKVLFPLAVVPATAGRLWSLRPHVVQVHESDGALAALLTVLLRPLLALLRRPRPKLVALLQVSYVRERRAVRALMDHSPDGARKIGEPGSEEIHFRRFKAPLQILLGRLTARLADLVLAPSEQTAEELRQDYGITSAAVLPNVTGGLEVMPEPCGAAADEASGYLLFVGRLRIRKGVETLLEALAVLRNRAAEDPSLRPRLLVAGDGEHRPALEAVVRRLELQEQVRFLGRCGAGEVRALLAEALALVVPSTYEGMPLVILEAMEAAVPVIASRVSGIPEVVVDGETGWVVPAEDVTALAEALEHALGDSQEAWFRGRAGRSRLDQHYRPRHAAKLWQHRVLGTSLEAGNEPVSESPLEG
jgi:glycosyltransferase involved in cell wall biosynthesis